MKRPKEDKFFGLPMTYTMELEDYCDWLESENRQAKKHSNNLGDLVAKYEQQIEESNKEINKEIEELKELIREVNDRYSDIIDFDIWEIISKI